MMKGNFWILPDATVTENDGFEHGHYAKRAMLNLDKYDAIPAEAMFYPQDWLKPFSERQVEVFRERGVPEDRLEYLAAGRDPRNWVILNFDWIRVHDGKHFGVREWNDETLERIQHAYDFWAAQPKADLNDMLSIEEVSTHAHFETPVKRLRYAEDADAVRGVAEGVGRWHNPAAGDHREVMREIKAALSRGEEPETLKPLWAGLDAKEQKALYLWMRFQLDGIGCGNSLGAALHVIAAQLYYAEVLRQENPEQLSEKSLT